MDRSFSAAISVLPPVITITSMNEWHEGTQIERAVPKQNYLDYGEGGPNLYLVTTAELVDQWREFKTL